ncbi:hypothetical protein CKM354_000508400 [Cercospora kikuchii]|uniref:N-acetyltransferase domain-containing protein n=1 Tax=Cercospora kikuchii TaxID=84275 RepID=A0A9P3FGS7_9PEZI|nr:uncharacterized protein CKM354_000508400 [Cercospora kikuchii]GIZ41790.1 hypothetical protein CKM354_000508400 [Cercospora kikuchii]
MGSQPGIVLYENESYLIRPAVNTDEFRKVWWGFMQTLGWNRGYYDLDTYMNPSRGYGMFLLIDKASNTPVGHVAGIVNQNSTGWVSMFIIDERHRGKGLGRELFKAAEYDLARNGVQCIGLDGVVEQKQTYERRNFVSSPLGTIRIMVRPLVEKDPVPRPQLPEGSQMIEIRDLPPELLAEHELSITGFERPALWSGEHLFHRPDVHGVALILTSNPISAKDLGGWAVNRRCSGGVRIGPVYATDPASARAILVATMELARVEAIRRVPLPNEEMNDCTAEQITEQATLVTEVWGGNADAIDLFGQLGWKPAGVDYYRMWVDGKATLEQSKDGAAQKSVYAIFDAATG